MAAAKDNAAVSWAAVSTATALLARLQVCPDVSRDALLEGDDPGEVLAAMEVITAALTGAMFDDRGARFLELLGEAAVTGAARQP